MRKRLLFWKMNYKWVWLKIKNNLIIMSSFTNEIKLQALKDNKWLLLEDFIFYENPWKEIIVKKWFITDWASIPSCLRFIWCPLDLPVLKWAILHDWLRKEWYDREYSDSLFLLSMRVAWVNNIRAILFYIAVRLWWYFIYKKYWHDIKY